MTEKRAVHVTAQPNETDNEAIARALFEYPFQAEETISRYLNPPFSKLGNDLIAALKGQVNAVNKGDMKGVEALLVSQAHTLDAIFHCMARNAINAEYLSTLETKLKLALRAQAQCARTLETLATIKNPPVVFAKQANVATNQQINVGIQAGPPPARQPAIDAAPQPQPQLDHTHGNYLDAGTPAAASRTDTAMATLEEVHRTEDTGR